jgi:hypothetical protein
MQEEEAKDFLLHHWQLSEADSERILNGARAAA